MKQQFCVAMSDDYPGTAHAACVKDHQRALHQFFQAHAGCQFKIVSAKEMNELLRAYRDAKWRGYEIQLGGRVEGPSDEAPGPTDEGDYSGLQRFIHAGSNQLAG